MRGALRLELSWSLKTSPGFTSHWTIRYFHIQTMRILICITRKTLNNGNKEFIQLSSGTNEMALASQDDDWNLFSVNFTLESDLTSNAASLDIYIGGTPNDVSFFLDQVTLDAVIAANPNKGRKNILFIGADDLRPNLGIYSSVTSDTLGGPNTVHKTRWPSVASSLLSSLSLLMMISYCRSCHAYPQH